MKKLILILSALFMLSDIMSCREKGEDRSCRFTFGAEWNYIGSFHCGIHHNFFSEEGYRVDLNHTSFGYKSNGDIYLHAGIDLREKWNISLYTGLAGVYDIGKIIPMSVRATRYFKANVMGDRWFSFLDAGSGVCIKKEPQATLVGKVGAGYRIALSPVSSLDFILAYRMTLTHPEIIYDGYEVLINMTNRNNAYISAISIGLSLSF